MAYPSETADRFIVRLPSGLRDRIRDIAAENRRSMNAEIVYQLARIYADESKTVGERQTLPTV